MSDTVNVRVAAARRETKEELERALRRSTMRLLGNEDFHRFMANLLFGLLGLNKEARDSQVASARRDAAALILGRLTALDVAGARAISMASWDAIEAELEVTKPNPEDKIDG